MKEIKKPLVVLNFKAYFEALGEKGMKLAKIAEKIAEEIGASIAICPPIPYLAKYAENFNIPIFSQKIDNSHSGHSTGKITVEMLKMCDISGALVNHTDNAMTLADLEKVVRDSRTYRLYTIIYASNEVISAAAAKLDPNAVAFEPPEILNTDISVSSIQPELIENIVKRIKLENPKVSPFCSVGISNKNDVQKVLELKIEGIIIDSAYVNAKDPYELLNSIAETIYK